MGHRRSLRLALFAILGADATIQTLMGRSTHIVVTWDSVKLDTGLPVLAYHLLPESQTGGDGDTRVLSVQLTAFADGNDSQKTIDDILDRCEALLTATALDAQSVNAAPLRLRRYDGDPSDVDREGSRGVRRGDLDVDLTIHQ